MISSSPPEVYDHSFSIYYHNCSGIRGKSKNIFLSVLENDFDVICLAETWLTSSFNSEEYFPASYNVFRRDRYKELDATQRGGGVLIAVSKNLNAKQIKLPSSNFEIIAIRCKYQNNTIVIVTVYLPSSSDFGEEDYIQFSVHVKNVLFPVLTCDDHLVIVGDFNFSNVSWHTIDDELVPINVNNTAATVIDSILTLGTVQRNSICNDKGSFLDLVFVSSDVNSTVVQTDEIGTGFSLYHTPLNLILTFNNLTYRNVESNNSKFSYNFRKGDYNGLNTFLENFDWDIFIGDGNLDDFISRFYDVLNVGMEQYIPRSVVKSQYREPWFNSRLTNLKNRKSNAHKKYKSNPSPESYAIYCNLRNEFKFLNRFLYGNYIVDIETGIKTDPKNFWRYVDSKKKCRGFPDHMNFNSVTSSDPLQICNFFASFFKNVYAPESLESPFAHRFNRTASNLLQLNVDDVYRSLSELNINMNAGPDGIPPILLKQCAFSLAKPLTILFNHSLSIGYFPNIWKISYIIPIFKKGSRSDVENYRGIAILSAVPKLFEKLVCDYIAFYTKNFISSRQHGFCSKRSTTTNLAVLCNFVSNSLERGKETQIVYTDFSKAFDKVDHHRLLSKLDGLNSEFIPIHWICSYLTNRFQKVLFNNVSSDLFSVTSGVPQGSHLGPLLFILFINDVVSCFNFSEVLIYADDLKIYKVIDNDDDVQKFQSDLNNFALWVEFNKLALNVSKCKTMCFSRRITPSVNSFYINGSLLESVSSFVDLGVLFSSNLIFKNHIDKIISKASSMLGFIIRFTKEFDDPYTLKTLYISFVRSHLEYASIIWNPYYTNASDRIESIQKRFLIYALRRLPRNNNLPRYILPSYISRCDLLNIEPLSQRRSIASAMFIRDLLTARIDAPDILRLLSFNTPLRSVRSSHTQSNLFTLRLEFKKTNYGRSEPIFTTSRVFNSVAIFFYFCLTREVFRYLIRFFFRSV